MNSSDFFKGVLVVIVLFRTKPEESSAYTSLHAAFSDFPTVPEIFIYDNSPHASPPNDPRVTYYHDGGNSGVSRAYNASSTHAQARDKTWLLLLDQDTTVQPMFLERLQDTVRAYPESVAFVPKMKDVKGWVSPFIFKYGKGRPMASAVPVLPLEKFRFVNSGLLIRLSAFVAAGGYDERIPLDFSDIAFAERLRNVTDHFRVIDFALNHAFSDSEMIPVEDALARYRHFCQGATAMGKRSGFPNPYLYHRFTRACRLCFRYKDLRFLVRFLQQPAHG